MFSARRYAALAAALGLGLAMPKANAAYVEYLYQSGVNVVASGSGSINTTGVTPLSAQGFPELVAADGFLLGGPKNFPVFSPAETFQYATGPSNFGSGGSFDPTTTSGDLVGVAGGFLSEIAVPGGYVSRANLSNTMTFAGQTLAALGVTLGTYTWTWGTGANTDSFTLHIGEAPPIPEPASLTVLAVGLAGLGLVLRTRRV